jgi:hypothetical protein
MTAENILCKPVLIRKLYALDFCYANGNYDFLFLFLHDTNSWVKSDF